jgi:hypothetical protein
MTLSLYERFTGFDWEGSAQRAGVCLVLACFAGAALGMLVGGVAASSSLLLAGLLTALWELPQLYSLVPQCAAATEFASSTLKMNLPWARAVVYFVAAALFLHGTTSTCIVVGLAFLVCCGLNVCAQINVMSDLHDGTANVGGGSGRAEEGLLSSSGGQNGGSVATTGFGTF